MKVLSILNEQESSVMIIRCNGGYVEAKKIHLAAMSEVFRKMMRKLGKHSNFIRANDVDFNTMKMIMDFYKEGKVSNFEALDKEQFSFIVKKYNFIGIKEEIAEHVLEIFFKKQDVEILGSIFSTFYGHFQKSKAIQELAIVIIKGNEGPNFVDDFSIPDFLELSRICCQALNGYNIARFQGFLNTLYRWLDRDFEERSISALEIAGMIDITSFQCHELLGILKKLKLCQQLQGFKKILQKSYGCGCK